MLALGVCCPQPCSSDGRRFAVSKSRFNYYEPFRSFPQRVIAQGIMKAQLNIEGQKYLTSSMTISTIEELRESLRLSNIPRNSWSCAEDQSLEKKNLQNMILNICTGW